MTGGEQAPPNGASDAELSRARNIGVGCFSTFVGFWSGGMIGVLVGKIVGSARNCAPPEGLPACDWYWFAAGGMLIGATTLPVLVLNRLRRRDAAGRSRPTST